MLAHSSAIVEDGAQIGEGTSIWHHAHIRDGAVVGRDCNLGKNVYVDAGAVIGDRCKLQNNVSVFDGVTLGNEVFVGPSVVFTNDMWPRVAGSFEVTPTLVSDGASIGANATIVCGVTIGRFATIGAGSVVTRNVESQELVVGNPARRIGWVCECGKLASRELERPSPILQCPNCQDAQ